MKTEEKMLPAGLTVEAAMVISLVLILLGRFLLGIISLHGKIAGRLVLAEAVERNIFFEERAGEEEGIGRDAVLEEEKEKLRLFRGAEEKELSVSEGLLTFCGKVSGPGAAEWQVEKYHPEAALRLLASVKSARGTPEGGEEEEEKDEG